MHIFHNLSLSLVMTTHAIFSNVYLHRGPGSLVGIATAYGLDGPGTEPWWGRDFLHLSRPALGPTQPPVQWVPGPSRGKREKRGRGVTLTPPPASAVVMKG